MLEDLSSLEPTLVGGINQRFNDLSGAQSRNLGFGLDAKEPNCIYAGPQYTRRHIVNSYGDVMDAAQYDNRVTTPLPPIDYGMVDAHSDADIVRGYVSTILSRSSALSSEALYQRVAETDQELRQDASFDSVVSTQPYRFGYRYFLGTHLSFLTQATYRDQQLNQTTTHAGSGSSTLVRTTASQSSTVESSRVSTIYSTETLPMINLEGLSLKSCKAGPLSSEYHTTSFSLYEEPLDLPRLNYLVASHHQINAPYH